jgi:hypothetical protein
VRESVADEKYVQLAMIVVPSEMRVNDLVTQQQQLITLCFKTLIL